MKRRRIKQLHNLDIHMVIIDKIHKIYMMKIHKIVLCGSTNNGAL